MPVKWAKAKLPIIKEIKIIKLDAAIKPSGNKATAQII